MTPLTRIIRTIVISLAAAALALTSGAQTTADIPPHITPEITGLLARLDSMLARSPEYTAVKEERLAQLRDNYRKASGTERRYWAAQELYDEYCAYDSDSAMYYADRAMRHAAEMGRNDLVQEMELNRSYLFSATGLIEQASHSLDRINIDSLPPALALKYCDRMLFLSTHRDQYIGVIKEAEAYSAMCDSLLQSLTAHIAPDDTNFCWLKGWSSMHSKEAARAAIPEVARVVDGSGLSTRRAAMDAWVLSKLYERVGDQQNRLKYLILSSMADVHACNKEIASLQEVAEILLGMGDLERANDYINTCINYANDYKSRVRIGALAAIQKQTFDRMHQRLERQARINRWYLIGLIAILGVLVLASLYILRQNRLLRQSRATLNDANSRLSAQVDELTSVREELNRTNARLSEMYETARRSAAELSKINEAKEEYIANIFTICSNYISKLDDIRTNIHKLLAARKFEEAARIAKSPELSYGEIKELYANFDSIFLQIYPDFVEDFNTLLRPEERITLRTPGKLTTELRIYALVRLGLNDSVKIARFLHCSVQTVYNTRQRTRNKASGPREEFADAVRALGKPSF